MKLRYDPEANAIAIYFADQVVARTRTVRKNRSDAAVDYAADGSVVGIELLGVRQGVDITGIPQAEQIAVLLREHGSTVGRKAPNYQDGVTNRPASVWPTMASCQPISLLMSREAMEQLGFYALPVIVALRDHSSGRGQRAKSAGFGETEIPN